MATATTYARARLRLGISTVGTLVVLSSLALAFDLPQRLFGRVDEYMGASLPEQLGLFAAFVGGFVLVFLPFDLVGGLILPKRYDRHDMTSGTYLAGWARGVIVQAAVLIFVALAILVSARLGGLPAVLVVVLVAVALLLWGQVALAVAAGGLRESPANDAEAARLAAELRGWNLQMPRRVLVIESYDIGFTGGIAGLPGRETVVLPGHWTHHLSLPVVAVAMARRIGTIQSGARARGVLVSGLFTLLGFVASVVASAALLGVPAELLLQTAPGLVTVSLFATLWAFVGVLVLPSVSRPAVFAADRSAQQAGASPQLMEDAIRALDRMQDDEPSRTPGVETIYHPIPNVESRLARLQDTATSESANAAAWNVNRLTLYLSWATLGLLGRAVHCNCGRPELWVMLPTD